MERGHEAKGEDHTKSRNIKGLVRHMSKNVRRLLHVRRVIQDDSPSMSHHDGRCAHCKQVLAVGQESYCCPGCEGAACLIKNMGLDAFYTMSPDLGGARAQVDENEATLALVDSPAFQKKMGTPIAEGRLQFTLGLGRLRCHACGWLIENAVRVCMPEAKAHVNITQETLLLSFPRECVRLGALVSLLARMGYEVSPFPSMVPQGRHENVIRLGVCFFVLGNVMTMAIADYLAMDGEIEASWRGVFRWASLALASVSVLYGAVPLYRGAWRQMRAKRASVDLPLAVAIVAAYVASAYHVMLGQGPVFFDSISALVALILLGRFFYSMALQRAHKALGSLPDASFMYVRRQYRHQHGEELVPLAAVKTGDLLRFLPGDVIPLNCCVCDGCGDISSAPVTGEPDRRAVKVGDDIEGGVQNGSVSLVVAAREDGDASTLWRSQAWLASLLIDKGRFVQRSEKIAGAFSWFVFGGAALILLLIGPRDMTEAMQRATAALLIACPCVLALGAPLVYTRAYALAMARGVIFRSQRAIENLADAKTFFFDKTGTLTQGSTIVQEAVWSKGLTALERQEALDILSSLATQSTHHATYAAAQWAKEQGGHVLAELSTVTESMGEGLALSWKGAHWRLGRAAFCRIEANHGNCYLTRDAFPLLSLQLDDPLLEQAPTLMASLTSWGIDAHLLSGDRHDRTLAVAKALNLPESHVIAGVTPSEKLREVTESKRNEAIAMVGNGFNDVLALAKVSVGVAVANAPVAVKDAADIILQRAGVLPLADAVSIARGARAAIRRIVLFASAYNLMGYSLAAGGYLSPMVAAIMMPASSVVVLVLASRWHMDSGRIYGRLVPATAT